MCPYQGFFFFLSLSVTLNHTVYLSRVSICLDICCLQKLFLFVCGCQVHFFFASLEMRRCRWEDASVSSHNTRVKFHTVDALPHICRVDSIASSSENRWRHNLVCADTFWLTPVQEVMNKLNCPTEKMAVLSRRGLLRLMFHSIQRVCPRAGERMGACLFRLSCIVQHIPQQIQLWPF